MNKEEREAKLKQRFIEMTQIESSLYSKGHSFIAGVDEVGRGPLAGPVVAATVVLPKDFNILGVDDSKKLSPKKRDELFDLISSNAVAIGLSFIDHQVIDEINILNATKRAMTESFYEANSNCEIDFLLTDAVKLENLPVVQDNLIKGDAKSISIAAASIIAKVARDRYMIEMDKEYPGYDFASNKGYGTARHYEGLNKMGLCPLHRKTFLKNYLNT